MTDSIADFLTRIRNAIRAKHRIVEIPASNLKKEITKILFDKDVQWNGSNVALIKFFSMFEKQERFAIVTPR